MECVCWSCRCSWSVCVGLVGVHVVCVLVLQVFMSVCAGLVGVHGVCVLVL